MKSYCVKIVKKVFSLKCNIYLLAFYFSQVQSRVVIAVSVIQFVFYKLFACVRDALSTYQPTKLTKNKKQNIIKTSNYSDCFLSLSKIVRLALLRTLLVVIYNVFSYDILMSQNSQTLCFKGIVQINLNGIQCKFQTIIFHIQLILIYRC